MVMGVLLASQVLVLGHPLVLASTVFSSTAVGILVVPTLLLIRAFCSTSSVPGTSSTGTHY